MQQVQLLLIQLLSRLVEQHLTAARTTPASASAYQVEPASGRRVKRRQRRYEMSLRETHP